jgi:hypothetical protein
LAERDRLPARREDFFQSRRHKVFVYGLDGNAVNPRAERLIGHKAIRLVRGRDVNINGLCRGVAS